MSNTNNAIYTIKQMIASNNVNLSLLYDCLSSNEPLIIIPLLIPKGESIIRVRINNHNGFFDDTNELTYPPVDKSKLMRASLPGHPMFYGSLCSKSPNPDAAFPRITTLYETSEAIRNPEYSGCQIVTYSKWELNKTISVFSLPISKKYKERTYDAINIQQWWEDLFKPNIDGDKGALSEFFCDLFAEEGSDSVYSVTANFVNFILERDKAGYQGVVYPTQQLNGDGFNIAITPSTVDRCCRLTQATTCFLNKQKMNANLVGFADAKWDLNGHIRWVPRMEVLSSLLENHPEISTTLNCFGE